MVGCRVYGADGCCSFVSGGGRIDVGRIVVGINPQASYIFAALVYRYAASGEIPVGEPRNAPYASPERL